MNECLDTMVQNMKKFNFIITGKAIGERGKIARNSFSIIL